MSILELREMADVVSMKINANTNVALAWVLHVIEQKHILKEELHDGRE